MAQREVRSASSRSSARRPMKARSSAARSRNIQLQPSSMGVERWASFQA